MTADKKFGVFYVTYNRTEILKKTIEATLQQSKLPDLLLIVDNANSVETRSAVTFFGRQEIVYHGSSENLGSAGGTALGVQWLYDHGYDFICCGDDDNPPFRIDIFERLLQILQNADPDVGGVGAVGALWDWKKGELVRLHDDDLKGILEVDFVGGNHLLIVRRETVSSVGTPNSRLFFGYPDLEYCLRIRKKGYRLLLDAELMKSYRTQYGKIGLRSAKSFLPRRSINSAWRDYYTTRNYIHMMRSTFQRSDLARRACFEALIKIGLSWLKGPSYGFNFARLKLRGIRDGYMNRLGQTVPPVPKNAVPPK